MDPAIAQALATLIGAITTAVLTASAYYWGPRQRDRRADMRRSRDQLLIDYEDQPDDPDNKHFNKRNEGENEHSVE